MRYQFRVLVFALMALCCSVYANASNGTKEWTFLIFLNGNNNLDSFGTTNMKQLETVGSTSDINIVVQWASMATDKTKRVLVQKSTDPNNVTSPSVEEMGRVDMGDVKVLEDFIHWGVAKYPAKHYFIDVWDHGGGWHRSANSEVIRNISYDELSGNSIDTVQLGQAMADAAHVMGHKVDLYGSDACMMGMVEIADEMSDSVAYFVGSEEVEPGAGWPYDKLMSRWAANPKMAIPEIGKILDEEYAKAYQGSGSEATMATYDLSKMGAVEQAMATFADGVKHLGASDLQKVTTAVGNSQAFYMPEYVDLGDFLIQLGNAGIPSVSPDHLAGIASVLKNYILDNKTTTGLAKAEGVSVWLPSKDTFTQYADKYRALKFAQHTGWADALDWLAKNSQ